MSDALRVFALVSAIIGLQLLALGLWTGTVRVLRKRYVNPEDAALNKAELATEDHADVARVKRAHQNLLENAVPFLAIGYFYAATGPSKTAAWVYFGTFAGARILHSIFYLWGRQPFRTLMFGVGVLATIGMAIQVIRASI